MSHLFPRRPRIAASTRRRGIRWWPLVAVTAADYLWQIPYALHQYGSRWDALAGLSIPLILTGIWFAIAVTATVRGRRGGRVALVAFLCVEVAFYLVHNASGAFAADLPMSNPVLLIASLLGYASTATAVVYLILIGQAGHAARAASARQPTEPRR
jgi:uncharacterized membrane protein